MAHRWRARARQSAGVEKRHAAGARTRSRCITVQPPATPRALTAVRLWLCAPSCKALDVSVSEGRPGEGRAVASGIMAEAGAMVPTSDSDLTGLSKVSVLQLLRMSLHERLCAATLLKHS